MAVKTFIKLITMLLWISYGCQLVNGPFKKMYTYRVNILSKNIFYFATLILTITCTSAANMRAQIQANASLISVLVVILYQNDRVV